MKLLIVLLVAPLLIATTAGADEVPIAGTVKAVDPAAQTILVESAVRGKDRQVTIDVPPGCQIMRFVRATDPDKSGFVEQPATLADLKPGWIVSVTTRHQGNREVADTIRVVTER